jgi:hypothetical protein
MEVPPFSGLALGKRYRHFFCKDVLERRQKRRLPLPNYMMKRKRKPSSRRKEQHA